MRIVAFRCLLCACAFLPPAAFGQFNITGVTDKMTYNDTATLTVVTQAGHRYSATLNWKSIPVGVPVAVNQPDFYELRVDATNQTTSAVTSQYRRFHVLSSERVNTEWGLPPHVPFPVIQSCSNEFASAHLRVMVPTFFPASWPLPVVVWVVDDQDRPVRANGILFDEVEQRPLLQVKRGVGSGFVPTETNATGKFLALKLSGIETNVSVPLASNIVWTAVSGVLNGNTSWPNGSRIQVTGNITIPNGSTLTVGEGSLVALNSRVDITNNGTVTINGTMESPVVLIPATNGQPWGGFVMKTANQGIVNATATIFTGSGAERNWFGANGNPGSHRVEQALFFCQAGQQLNLTNSAAIYLAGQLGHSVGATTRLNLTRFLMQRTTTGGEWTGARFTVNDSAFIECPDDSANFVDGDNDALYIVDGTHFFTNTLFGWTKDDGIDSGGGGYGPLTYQSCWFEAMFHEGNSLSGNKNTFARDTVYFDCGQGIEDGYGAPTGRVDHCLFSACQAGVRHGDNYTGGNGNYNGRFTGTNCISIYNHRDLFGFNWHNSGGWTNSYDRFFVSNNFVSVLDTNYPNNTLWNPASDGWRLGSLGGVGRVGIGFGARGTTLAQFPAGLPVGLSRFCTNEVRVDYRVDGTDGAQRSGTLMFPAGLTRTFIPLPTNFGGILRVTLLNPQHADITSASSFLMQNVATPVTSVILSPLGAAWKYLDNGSEQGTPWRGTNFNDGTWSDGVARLGFGSDANAFTTIRRWVTGTSGPQITNYYFRRAFVVTNPAAFTNVMFRYQRDDGCILYLNGSEQFRNNMTNGVIYATNFAMSNITPQSETAKFWTNVVPSSLLHAGTNWIAVEVHQSTATSGDIAWECEVIGIPQSAAARMNIVRLGNDAVVYWTDATFALEEADIVTGPWRPAATTNSPAGSTISSNRFFRLKK